MVVNIYMVLVMKYLHFWHQIFQIFSISFKYSELNRFRFPWTKYIPIIREQANQHCHSLNRDGRGTVRNEIKCSNKLQLNII